MSLEHKEKLYGGFSISVWFKPILNKNSNLTVFVDVGWLLLISENANLMKSCIKSACEALIAQESHLNDLDVGCGDGDTGSTLATGCNGRFIG